ncbi:MAG TPA: cysteine--tRNA ligase, partial [Bacillota bacterium]|nr:cysteine--tRNA ligase [Bacillota bacterium]
TVRDILKKYPGKVVRYYLVASHYRQPISFGLDELDMCARALARLEDSIINAMKAMRLGSEDISKSLEAAKSKVNDIQANNLITAADSAISSFIDFMDDDFNTSGAMSALHELARAINAFIAEGSRGEDSASAAAYAVGKLWRMGNVLGFMDDETLEADAAAALGEGEGLTGPLMELVLKIRADARAKKNWVLSDFIRDGLKELGITVEDTKDGARWKLERK